jgi:hypothetical protein
MSMTLFDWIKEITVTKTPVENFSEESWDSFNSYMISRYLSMDMGYIDLVNYVQTIPYADKKTYYKIYVEMIPKKNVYLKYIKSSKKSKSKEVAEYIARYYECSLGEADHYIDILRENGVRDVLWKMGIDKKEQDKLVKTI